MSLSQERVRRRISTSGLVTPEVVIEMLVFTIFRPPYAQFPGDDIPASPITPSVEEFTDYDSVVVFSAVGPAYNAKFFVISH